MIGRYSTDAVEGGHERRSAAAAEHQDERSGRSVEVFEQTSHRPRDAVRRQLDYVGVMRGGALAHRLALVHDAGTQHRVHVLPAEQRRL